MFTVINLSGPVFYVNKFGERVELKIGDQISNDTLLNSPDGNQVILSGNSGQTLSFIVQDPQFVSHFSTSQPNSPSDDSTIPLSPSGVERSQSTSVRADASDAIDKTQSKSEHAKNTESDGHHHQTASVIERTGLEVGTSGQSFAESTHTHTAHVQTDDLSSDAQLLAGAGPFGSGSGPDGNNNGNQLGNLIASQQQTASRSNTVHQDSPVTITGIFNGAVTEDNAITATGQLSLQGGAGTFPVQNYQGVYGTLTVDGSGQWSYQLDNAAANVQGLKDGEQVQEQFTIQAQNASGVLATQAFTVDVSGTGDQPTITDALVGEVTEDSQLRAQGQLDITDADRGEDHFQSGDIQGTYGTLHLQQDGAWTYDLNNQDPAIQALALGQQISDTLTVLSADGTSHQISIITHGTNDAPVIQVAPTLTAKEDDHGVMGKLHASDVDTGDTFTFSSPGIAGFHLASDGTYSFDPSDRAYQNLNEGMVKHLQVPYTVTDSQGATTTSVLEIDLTGTNDAPIFAGIYHSLAAVHNAQNGIVEARGHVTIIDADQGEAHFQTMMLQGKYGTLAIDQQGRWSYSADAHQPSLIQLQGAARLDETFIIKSADGTSHQIEVGIVGDNSPAIIVGDTAALIKEDTSPSVSGLLDITDPDAGEAEFHALDHITQYGHFHLLPDGHWTFTLDNQNPVVNALPEGQMLHERVLIGSIDGTPHEFDVRIIGTNDGAQITGASTGSVGEDATQTTNGQLQITDVDSGEEHFFDTDISGQYGTLHLSNNGAWQYQLNNGAANVQALKDGETVRDTITVMSADGTKHDIVISIDGKSDSAVISGSNTGAVTEESALHTSGTLLIVDPDAGEAHFQATDTDGQYGTLHLKNDGSWTYDLHNSNTQVQALGTSAGTTHTLTETLTVHSADGTAHTITVTVNGTNDGPVLNAISAATATEGDSAATIGTITSTDTDTGDSAKYTTTASTPGFTLNADGSYSFDPSNAAYNHIASGDTQQITVPITVTDGAGATNTKDLVITVTGTNDTPVLTTIAAQTATEGGATLNGQIASTDTDDHSQASYTATTPVAGFTLNADGSYSFDPKDTAYDHIAAGDTQKLIIPIIVTDEHGATDQQNLVITVTGTNDDPTLTVTPPHSVTEDAAAISGQLVAQDVDDHETTTFSIASPVDGLTLNTDGSYSFDPSHSAYQHLAAGQDQTVTIPVTVTDQSGGTDTQNLIFTVHGVADAAVIAGTDTGSTTEDTHLTATGSLSITDADGGQAHFSAGDTAGSYGTLHLQQDGSWTYDLDNANTQVQALGTSTGTTHTLTETLTVHSADGTAHTITVTVNGTNDGPVLNAISAATATEGDSAATIGTITSTDTDTGDSAKYTTTASTPGFTLNADGSYSFDPSNTAYNHIASGDTQQITVPITVTDGAGATNTKDLVITVTGTNDTPVLTTIAAQTATEGGATLNGQIASTDTDDHSQASYTATTPVAGFTLNADGSYSFDPKDTAYDHIAAGDTQKLIIPIVVTDEHGATDQQNLVITVTGTNDDPTLTVTPPHSVTEDAAAISGQLVAQDVDDHETTTFSIASPIDGLTLNADGSYSFDPSHSAYQHLAAGQDQTVTIPVTVTDQSGGTDTQNLVITVHGVADAAIIAGTDTGSTTEDTHLTATGSLSITDADGGQAHFNAGDTAGSYGTLHLQQDGSWTYNLDNANTQVQALGTSAGTTHTLTETLTVHSADGTAHTITVTVNGTNDAPVIAAATATAAEGASAISGSLTATDTDTGDVSHFTTTSTAAGLSLNDNGSYTFDPANSAYNHLAVGETQTLTIPVTVTDGAGATDTHNLVITVTGTNDTPTAHPSFSAGTEDTSYTFSASEFGFTDIDTSDTLDHVTITALPDAAKGVLMFNGVAVAAGADIDAADISKLTFVPAQDVNGDIGFKFTVNDGHTDSAEQAGHFTLAAVDDASVITGDAAAAIDEGDIGDTTTAAGDLAISDVDTGENPDFPDVASTATTYGHIAMVGGHWQYTLDQSKVQDLDPNDADASKRQVTDTHTFTASDGSTQVVTITIAGTNDAPIIEAAHAAPSGSANPALKIESLDIIDAPTGKNIDVAATNAENSERWGADTHNLPSGAKLIGLYKPGSDHNWIDPANPATTSTDHSAAGGFSRVDSHDWWAQHNIPDTVNTGSGGATGHGNAWQGGIAVFERPNGEQVVAIINRVASGSGVEVDYLYFHTYQNLVPGHAVISGAATAGDHVEIKEGSTVIGTAIADNHGHWEVASSALSSGHHTLHAEVNGAVSAEHVYDIQGHQATNITPAGFNADIIEDSAQPTVSGELRASDADHGDTATIDAQQNVATQYGHFSIDASGVYHFTLDNANAAVNSLGLHQTLQETIVVTAHTADGEVATQNVVITIDGALDAPTLSAQVADSQQGSDIPINLNAALTDTGGDAETLTVKIAGLPDHAQLNHGHYDSIAKIWTVSASELPGLTLDLQNPNFHGDLHFSVTATATSGSESESTTQTVSLFVNAPPVLASAITDVTTEDTAHHTIDLLQGATDADTGTGHTGLTISSTTYSVNGGTAQSAVPEGFSLSADGHTLVMDASNTHLQSMAAGEHETIVVHYTISDPDGASVQQTASITVNGQNDAPTLGAIATISCNEDDSQVQGQLVFNDKDTSDTLTFSVVDAHGAPLVIDGLSINADGSYTFNPADNAYQQLDIGEHLSINAKVIITDSSGGTAEQALHINLVGTQDVPVVGSATLPDQTEDRATDFSESQLIAMLQVTDADLEDIHIEGLTIDPSAGHIQQLGQVHGEAHYRFVPAPNFNGQNIPYSVDVTDGRAHITAHGTVNILAVNDLQHVGNVNLGTTPEEHSIQITEAELLAHTTDVDTAKTALQVQHLHVDPAIGSLTGDRQHGWTFTPAQDWNSVKNGGNAPFTFDVIDTQDANNVAHGRANLNVTPVQDQAIITDTTTGSKTYDLTEDGASDSVQGTISISDVDGASEAKLITATQIVCQYGTVNLVANPDGSYTWTYQLNNNAANVQALNVNETVVEQFTVQSVDGTSKTIDIHIHGTNDLPTVTSVGQFIVHEDAGSVDGQFSVHDNDKGDTVTYTVQGNAPAGLTVNSDGSYHFDPSSPAYNHLKEGEIVDVLAQVAVQDAHGGTTVATLKFEVVGNNDAPTIQNVDFGSVTETQASPLTFSATDLLKGSNDPDGDTLVVTAVHLSDDSVGKLVEDGLGGYTFEPSHTLTDGELKHLQISFTVSESGSAVSYQGTATLDVHGVNESPIIDTQHGDNGNYNFGNFEAGQHYLLAPSASTLLHYISDPETDPMTVTGVRLVDAQGRPLADQSAIVDNGDGTFTFSPTSAMGAAHQSIHLEYDVSDGVNTIQANAHGAVDPIQHFHAHESTHATEDTTFDATGRLIAAQADGSVVQFKTETLTGSTFGGSLSLHADGTYTYHLSAAQMQSQAVQKLSSGHWGYDSFTVTGNDGQAHHFTVRIAGTDDAAIIEFETGADQDLTALESPIVSASGTLKIIDIDDDAGSDHFEAKNYIAGQYGHMQLDNVGHYTYFLHGDTSDVKALNTTESLVDHITITSAEGVTQQVAITIHGANDAPIVSAITPVQVSKTGSAISGQITATDEDHGDTATYRVAPGTTAPDGFTINADGSYSFDPQHAAYQGIIPGDKQLLTIPIQVTDSAGATGTRDLVITVKGGNASPTADAHIVVGNTLEDTPITFDERDLLRIAHAADADHDLLHVTAISCDSKYGTFTDDGRGHFTFTPAKDVFADDVELHFKVSDGQTTTAVSALFDIGAVNDAAHIDPFTLGATQEDSSKQFSVQDLLSHASDVEGDTLSLDGIPTVDPRYGSITGDATNGFVFTPAANFFGNHVPINFAVTDGTDVTHASTSIDVRAVADAATFVEVSQQFTQEDLKFIAHGQIDVHDLDGASQEGFRASNNITGTYGYLVIGASGNWAYHLNHNGAAGVQGLADGEKFVEHFTLHAKDGTAHDLSVDILGTQDAATISGQASSSINEDSASVTGALQIHDADIHERGFVAQHNVAGSFGHLEFTSSGQWTYTLDNSLSATQALAVGDTRTETFTVSSVDGSASKDIVVTINGTNDAPVIASSLIASAAENNPSQTLDLLTGASDVDATDALTISGLTAAIGTAAATSQLPDGISLGADGHTLTIDPANAVFNHLAVGQTQTLAISYNVIDGNGGSVAQTASITITGTNDAPTVTTSVAHPATLPNTNEDTDTTYTEAQLLTLIGASDVDGDTLHISAIDMDAQYGTFTQQTGGSWVFSPTADLSIASIPLTLHVSDGTASVEASAQVGIDAVADTAVISGDDSASSLTEDGHLYSGNLQTGINQLHVTDPDPGEAMFQITGSSTGGTGASERGNWVAGDKSVGEFILHANGQWIYRVDNSNAAVQGLKAGETFSETVTVHAKDGTPVTLTATVAGANDGPEVTASSAHPATLPSTDEDTDTTYTEAQLLTLIGASDVDGDTLHISAIDMDAQYGTFTQQTGGSWVFSPTADLSIASIPLTLHVSDGTAAVEASAQVGIDAVADDPTLTLDLGTTNIGTHQTAGATQIVDDVSVLVSSGTQNLGPMMGGYLGEHHLSFYSVDGDLSKLLTSIEVDGTSYTPTATAVKYMSGDGDGVKFSGLNREQLTGAHEIVFHFNSNAPSLMNIQAVIQSTDIDAPAPLGTGIIDFTVDRQQTGTSTVDYYQGDYDEDDQVDLHIAVSSGDTDGSEHLSVVVDGIPAGASLSAGQKQADGTWVLETSELTGLKLNPAADWSGTMQLQVTAKSAEGGQSAEVTQSLHLNFAPQAEAPQLSATSATVTGDEDHAIALNVQMQIHQDSSETQSIVVRGVPTGASLSAGHDNGDGSWTLTTAQLAGLTLTPAANFAGTISLAFTATSTESSGAHAEDSLTLNVEVQPIFDMSVSAHDSQYLAGETLALPLSIANAGVDAGESFTANFNLPAGWQVKLADGSTVSALSSDPTLGQEFSLTAVQVQGAELIAPANFAGSQAIEFTCSLMQAGETQTTHIPVTMQIASIHNIAGDIEDTAHTYTEQDILGMLGGVGSGSSNPFSVSDISLDARFGTFIKQPNGDWLLTPKENYHGDTPFTVTLTDGTNTHVANTHVIISPVTDAAHVDMTISAQQTVMAFAADGSGSVMNQGQLKTPDEITKLAVEFNIIGGPQVATQGIHGATFLSYGTTHSENEFYVWKPTDLTVRIGAHEYATGIDTTDGQTHRYSVLWDSATGHLEVLVDGVSEFSQDSVAQGYKVPGHGILTLAQDQDHFALETTVQASQNHGFGAADAYHGQIFSTAMATNVDVSPASLEHAPLGEVVHPDHGLVINIQSDFTGTPVDVTHHHQLAVAGAVTPTQVSVDTHVATPQSHALLELHPSVTPPTDSSDTITMIELTGLVKSTHMSDGHGHSHTVTGPDEHIDIHDWDLTVIHAQLPGGAAQNMNIGVLVETTGPDGATTVSSSQHPLVLDPTQAIPAPAAPAVAHDEPDTVHVDEVQLSFDGLVSQSDAPSGEPSAHEARAASILGGAAQNEADDALQSMIEDHLSAHQKTKSAEPQPDSTTESSGDIDKADTQDDAVHDAPAATAPEHNEHVGGSASAHLDSLVAKPDDDSLPPI